MSRWIEAYVKAWKAYDPEAIGDLFSEDVEYWFHPYDDPVIGRDAVVEAWLGQSDHPGASARDQEGTYEGDYAPVAIDGDIAVVTGTSTYADVPGGRVTEVYDNCFLITFDADGRCRRFAEYYVKRPEGKG